MLGIPMPYLFAGLVGVATVFLWFAISPPVRSTPVVTRLNDYLQRDVALEAEMQSPLPVRLVASLGRPLLRLLGMLTPKRNITRTQTMLLQAGQPGNLSVLDFYGLRLLIAVGAALLYFLIVRTTQPFAEALRNGAILGALGFLLPVFWLRTVVRRRQNEITRFLPDALDMLTIGVEAGLGFESALLRLTERWDNALSREFRQTVAEMRVGIARDVALRRLAERTGVPDLNTFVAILIQSTKMGVSIAQVLHSQADQMRLRRRQRAEELARQASVKMVFPLVFLIFPAMFVVIIGPGLPVIQFWLSRMSSGGQ